MSRPHAVSGQIVYADSAAARGTLDPAPDQGAPTSSATVRWLRRLTLGAFVLAGILAGPDAYTAEVDKPAPAIALPQLQSEQMLTLASLQGRVVLLDFWASWCGPCRQSLPEYQKLRDEFSRDDFEVLAVSVDEERDDALAFLKKFPLQFPLLLDAGSEVARAYGLKGMPSSYLIDRHGVLRSSHVGFQIKDIALLRSRIQQLVAEKP